LAQLDYDNPRTREKLVAYWSDYIRHYLRLGVRGFRCDAAYQVPAEVWDELITTARNEVSDVLFVAETLGSTVEQVSALQPAGFDYLFNSSKWWDFKAPWLLNQYEEFRRIAPSIAFPESHDTDRLINELDNQDREQMARHYRFGYLFAAAFSSGVMIPMGFEYGFSKPLHVVHTTPEDWFTQVETSPFDITAFIAKVNAMKAACPALNCEGPQHIVSDSAQEVVALYRQTGEADENDSNLTLVNPSPQNTARVDVSTLLSKVQQTPDVFTEVTPEQAPENFEEGEDLLLEPLAVRVFRGGYKSPKTVVLNETGFSDVTIRRSSRISRTLPRTTDTKKA
jgi:starch synthase (maltosyl-transferring)